MELLFGRILSAAVYLLVDNAAFPQPNRSTAMDLELDQVYQERISNSCRSPQKWFRLRKCSGYEIFTNWSMFQSREMNNNTRFLLL